VKIWYRGVPWYREYRPSQVAMLFFIKRYFRNSNISGRVGWVADAHRFHSKKSSAAFVDGRGLLFPGDLGISMYVPQ